jgi:hypothetical protein
MRHTGSAPVAGVGLKKSIIKGLAASDGFKPFNPRLTRDKTLPGKREKAHI